MNKNKKIKLTATNELGITLVVTVKINDDESIEVDRYMQDAKRNRLGGTVEVADEFNGFAHLMAYYDFVIGVADDVMGEADDADVPKVVN